MAPAAAFAARGRGGTGGTSARMGVAALLVLAICLTSPLEAEAGAPEALPESPRELQEQIIQVFAESSPCVRLLHTRGVSGCAGSAERVPIRHYGDLHQGIDEPTILLIEEMDLPHFLSQYVAGSEEGGAGEAAAQSGANTFSKFIRGGLIVTNNATVDGARPSHFSIRSTFPLSQFAPYDAGDYKWNPDGLDLMYRDNVSTSSKQPVFPPLFLLTQKESDMLRSMAGWNRERAYRYPLYVGNVNSIMWAEKDSNSFECLKSKRCLPIGGYSMFSSLPKPAATSEGLQGEGESCVLVLAKMDGADLFHSRSRNAQSTLSGLIAVLSAYESLANVMENGGGVPKRRIAFGLLSGEDWGLSGSRRLIHDLAENKQTISGCSLANLSYVIEVGSVGRSNENGSGERDGSSYHFYLHATEGSEDKGMSDMVFQTFVNVSASLGGLVSVSKPTGTPGIPPSSLMSFQTNKKLSTPTPSVPGTVLADFERELSNPYESTYLDDAHNVHLPSIATAADLLAKVLRELAGSRDEVADANPGLDPGVNKTVYHLGECLLSESPGMQCGLVQRMADSAIRGDVPLYPGVLNPYGPPKNLQHPADKSDLARFIWSFLALKSEGAADEDLDKRAKCNFPSVGVKDPSKGGCEGAGEVCARWRPVNDTSDGSTGRCVRADTMYLPGWSHLLTHNGTWEVVEAAIGDETIVDELWTESYWPTGSPSVSAYLSESKSFDLRLFLSGIIVTLGSWYLVRRGNLYYIKQAKSS